MLDARALSMLLGLALRPMTPYDAECGVIS